jgi:hypothetical protein
MVADEVQIDPERFVAFVRSFQGLMLATRPLSAFHALSGACFGIAAVLASRVDAAFRVDDAPATAALFAEGLRWLGTSPPD